MKKSKFLGIISETINEEKAFNDAGEPLMTHSQFRDHSEPAEQEYDPQDDRSYNTNDSKPFADTEWKEIYEMVRDNTLQVATIHINDFTEYLISYDTMRILRDSGVFYFDSSDNIPFFDVERSEIPSYEEFISSVEKAKEDFYSGAYEERMNKTYQQDARDSYYAQGERGLSEQAIKNIYNQFKNIIKENVDEKGFSDNIKRVFYEFVETEKDNPISDPDSTIEKGKNMKDLGQAVEDLGNKAKSIGDKAKTIPTTQTTRTIEEYVEEEILPPILEIIKQSENPRATKKELLEMFNMGKKL